MPQKCLNLKMSYLEHNRSTYWGKQWLNWEKLGGGTIIPKKMTSIP